MRALTAAPPSRTWTPWPLTTRSARQFGRLAVLAALAWYSPVLADGVHVTSTVTALLTLVLHAVPVAVGIYVSRQFLRPRRCQHR